MGSFGPGRSYAPWSVERRGWQRIEPESLKGLYPTAGLHYSVATIPPRRTLNDNDITFVPSGLFDSTPSLYRM